MCFLLFLRLYLWCSLISFIEIYQKLYSTSHPAGYKFLNMKTVEFVKALFWFLQMLSFTIMQKTGLTGFPEKQPLTKVKYLLPACQILWNFTDGNTRKFTVGFAFCARVDTIYRKTLHFGLSMCRLLEHWIYLFITVVFFTHHTLIFS